MHDAHADALKAGLAWRPVVDSDRARPPYELRPGTGRRGPDELWATFDAAVAQLNSAGAGDNLADIVAAYGAVADAAAALADALEAAGE
jgi:sugar (pentulose or hexulose) kinase